MVSNVVCCVCHVCHVCRVSCVVYGVCQTIETMIAEDRKVTTAAMAVVSWWYQDVRT